jgi:hypothetical protein
MTDMEESDMTRTYNKPWMIQWVEALSGLKPLEQAIGLAMAYYSDENGKVDNFTWDEFAERAGIRPGTSRKSLRDAEIIQLGFLKRHQRKVGNVNAMPMFTINLETLGITPKR